mgnify:CR=1 FL=1
MAQGVCQLSATGDCCELPAAGHAGSHARGAHAATRRPPAGCTGKLARRENTKNVAAVEVFLPLFFFLLSMLFLLSFFSPPSVICAHCWCMRLMAAPLPPLQPAQSPTQRSDGSCSVFLSLSARFESYFCTDSTRVRVGAARRAMGACWRGYSGSRGHVRPQHGLGRPRRAARARGGAAARARLSGCLSGHIGEPRGRTALLRSQPPRWVPRRARRRPGARAHGGRGTARS